GQPNPVLDLPKGNTFRVVLDPIGRQLRWPLIQAFGDGRWRRGALRGAVAYRTILSEKTNPADEILLGQLDRIFALRGLAAKRRIERCVRHPGFQPARL